MSINYHNVLNHFLNKKKSKNFFAKDTLCEDYIWGIYPTCCNTLPQRNDGQLFSAAALKQDNVIIIIAESPHRSEYSFKNNKIQFKSPLHRCDNKIQNYLNANANGWFGKVEYDVVLVNAIQYQCSFGLSLWNDIKNRAQKNEVFRYTWDKEPCEQDLLARIEKIIQKKKEVIIINACTKCLKPQCNSIIFSKLKNKTGANIKVYDERHPSKW